MVGKAEALCPLLAVGNCHTDCTNILYEAWCTMTGNPEFSLYQLEHLQDSVAVQVRAIRKEKVQRPKPTCGYITSATATDFTARSLSLQAVASPEITV